MFRVNKYLIFLFLLVFNFCEGQNYHAVNGSPYAGSLGSAYNPASIVYSPYAWDITPFAVQVKQSTNAFTIKNYSLLSNVKNAEVSIQNGTKKRYFFANQDIRLLNTRISLNAKASVAFGANVRNYVYALNSKSNWQDSIFSLRDFMKINTDNLPLSGEFVGSAWAEVYGSYAQTIIDDGRRLLNVGITLKLNHAVAGGYANSQGVNYVPNLLENGTGYSVTTGSLRYGYSKNFDAVNNSMSSKANRKAFLQKTYPGIGADFGIEYILIKDEDDEEDNDNDYDSKIGISIMDLGSNKYNYSSKSRFAIAGKEGVTDSLLENKFSSITTADNFNDSLATISNSIVSPDGNFFIYQPTRLVINVDQHINQNLFINAELTLPLMALAPKNTLFIKDMNLLAVTPRWETKSLGVYFPLLLNAKGQVWLGGAFKAGPLLLGLHNFGDLFSKNKTQNGGLYLAITIRPAKKYVRQEHYPREKLTGKERRSLACPKL